MNFSAAGLAAPSFRSPFMRSLLKELGYEIPARQLSPEQQEKLRQLGQGLAQYRPWAKGRIGRIERRVHSELIGAEHQGLMPITTGWMLKRVYPAPHRKWMYDRIKLALATFADPIGRGNGQGRPVLWRLRPDNSGVRKKKERAYARAKLTAANAPGIVTITLTARLPTFFQNRTFVQAGGLMSYGPNFPDMFRRTADLVDKILRGAKPGDIPVEQPTKFEFVINLKTAKALGLSVSQTMLATADEVIE